MHFLKFQTGAMAPFTSLGSFTQSRTAYIIKKEKNVKNNNARSTVTCIYTDIYYELNSDWLRSVRSNDQKKIVSSTNRIALNVKTTEHYFILNTDWLILFSHRNICRITIRYYFSHDSAQKGTSGSVALNRRKS